jgi:hypothetical protein
MQLTTDMRRLISWGWNSIELELLISADGGTPLSENTKKSLESDTQAGKEEEEEEEEEEEADLE